MHRDDDTASAHTSSKRHCNPNPFEQMQIHIQGVIKSADESKRMFEEDYARVKAEAAEKDATLRKAKQQLTEATAKIAAAHQEASETKQALAKMTTSYDRALTFKKDAERHADSVKRLEEEVERHKTQLVATTEDMKKTKRMLDEAKKKIEEVEENLIDSNKADERIASEVQLRQEAEVRATTLQTALAKSIKERDDDRTTLEGIKTLLNVKMTLPPPTARANPTPPPEATKAPPPPPPPPPIIEEPTAEEPPPAPTAAEPQPPTVTDDDIDEWFETLLPTMDNSPPSHPVVSSITCLLSLWSTMDILMEPTRRATYGVILPSEVCAVARTLLKNNKAWLVFKSKEQALVIMAIAKAIVEVATPEEIQQHVPTINLDRTCLDMINSFGEDDAAMMRMITMAAVFEQLSSSNTPRQLVVVNNNGGSNTAVVPLSWLLLPTTVRRWLIKSNRGVYVDMGHQWLVDATIPVVFDVMFDDGWDKRDEMRQFVGSNSVHAASVGFQRWIHADRGIVTQVIEFLVSPLEAPVMPQGLSDPTLLQSVKGYGHSSWKPDGEWNMALTINDTIKGYNRVGSSIDDCRSLIVMDLPVETFVELHRCVMFMPTKIVLDVDVSCVEYVDSCLKKVSLHGTSADDVSFMASWAVILYYSSDDTNRTDTKFFERLPPCLSTPPWALAKAIADGVDTTDGDLDVYRNRLATNIRVVAAWYATMLSIQPTTSYRPLMDVKSALCVPVDTNYDYEKLSREYTQHANSWERIIKSDFMSRATQGMVIAYQGEMHKDTIDTVGYLSGAVEQFGHELISRMYQVPKVHEGNLADTIAKTPHSGAFNLKLNLFS